MLKNPYVAFTNEGEFLNTGNDIDILENSITPEICPFSLRKKVYTRMNYKINE